MSPGIARYNPAAMDTTQKDRQFWLGMAISALCLVGIFFFIKPRDIIDPFRHINYVYLTLGALNT